MHIRLIAVGDRQPPWVDDALGIYTGRFPREWKFHVDRISTAKRSKNNKSRNAMRAESEQILAKIDAHERVVMLDERGAQLSSRLFASRLNDWHTEARDVCFVIGGPDGVSAACRKRADTIWSLSELTLPHGLARVLCVEQLYRAWSLQSGHPYHRD